MKHLRVSLAALSAVLLVWQSRPAMAEDIRLGDCEIRGADSFGDVHKMFRWPPGESAPIPFAWAQFEHDGDEFCHITSNTFSAQFHYQAITSKAYLERKAYYTNDDEDSIVFELTPSDVPGDDWQTKTLAFFGIEDVENSVLPFPAAGVHFRLRENCGSKQVVKEDGSTGNVSIGNSDARFKVVSIGFAYGNWAANWQGMDFHVGDAPDNFDNFALEHERATDYVEFTTQESGQCTIQAYCRKKAGEGCSLRVKVNGSVKATPDLDNADFAWADLWTGELAGGDTIRIENNEWEESTYWGLSSTFHFSCVEFSNEASGQPAFRVVSAGGGTEGDTGGPPPPPPPPPPADTTPPVITNVAAGPVAHASAILHFDVNEDVQWRVEYGTTAAYGLTTTTRDFDATHATSLVGLSPRTAYHFHVIATDRAGNAVASGDATFTTTATPDRTPPTITNVQATANHNSMTVTWTTNEAANSMLHYSRASAAPTWTGLPDFVTQHSVTATDLTPNTQYTYWVRSSDATGNIGESIHILLGTTTPPDTVAPRITSPGVTGITQSSATVHWETSESATSTVRYGTTAALGLEEAEPGFALGHSITLSRLQSNQTYHYQIETADAAGNAATHAGTFTTEPPDEGRVDGRVTRQGSGTNVAGAKVSLKGLVAFAATTGADGSYSFSGVPTGQRTVLCTAPGFRPQEAEVTVRRAQTTSRGFMLTAVGCVWGTISGPLLDNGVPTARVRGVNGATVRLMPGERTTQTTYGCLAKGGKREAGFFAFDDLPAGALTLQVAAEGYVPQTVSVSLPLTTPGQVVKQDVALVAAQRDLSTSDADLTTNPTGLTVGTRVSIFCKVSNGGNVEARNTKVRFKWGNTVLGERNEYSIAAGGSRRVSCIWDIPAGAVGAGTLTAIVDPDNAVAETAEGNNVASRGLTVRAVKPDLKLDRVDVTHTPANPAVGSSCTIKATVRNVGTADAEDVKLVLKRGTTVLSTKTKSSLDPGESYTASMAWTIPAGTYEPVDLMVVADPDGTMDELDEANNAVPFTVTPAKPDLSVTAAEFTHVPAAPLAGTEVTLKVKVRNNGAAKAQNVRLKVVYHEVVLGEATISSLSSGSSATREVDWDIPADLGGEVMLKAIVDATNAIPESDEGNNSATHEFTITPRRIDLVVGAADITHSPATPKANHTVSITAKVRNAGNVKATAVKVRFLRGGAQIGEKTISSISAGKDATTTLSWKVPAGTTGAVNIEVRVDPLNTIVETSETNNTATHSVAVASP